MTFKQALGTRPRRILIETNQSLHLGYATTFFEILHGHELFENRNIGIDTQFLIIVGVPSGVSDSRTESLSQEKNVAKIFFDFFSFGQVQVWYKCGNGLVLVW